MNNEILDIDHLMVNVTNGATAGDHLEQLGFTVTPSSHLPGLSNRLICFKEAQTERYLCNYVELMTLEDPDKAPPPMPQLLSKSGPVSIVLSTNDARRFRENLHGKGLHISQVLDLEREWVLPSGEVLDFKFSVAIPDIGQAPFYWNFCQHKTPQHYVRPEFTAHPNRARKMSEVIALSHGPMDAARHYARYWDAEIQPGDPVRVRRGALWLSIYDREGIERRYPGAVASGTSEGIIGFGVRTEDIGAARSIVEASVGKVVSTGLGFAVSLSSPASMLIAFEPAHAEVC